jgi:hypothetical protein
MFQKLIKKSNGNYSKYIIMLTILEGAVTSIKTLPVQDVYILDQTNTAPKDYPSVYQNFLKDIYNALIKGKA